jgi:hypothetical protein
MDQPVVTEQWDEISSTLKTILNYDYASSQVALRNLYEKAKREQWNAGQDIDWSIPVDVERGILNDRRIAIYGTPLWDDLDEKRRRRLNYLESAWSLSQFLHGEQGSLLVCGQLVDCIPALEAKFYAASQTFDEARHVEVFERYLNEKLGGVRPIDRDLRFILDIALSSELWQMKCICMQILIEGLALGAFHTAYDSAYDPLIQQIVLRVIKDEARHVAFGVIMLREEIPTMSDAERVNLEDFCFSACQMMATGFFPEHIYREVGFTDMEELREIVMHSTARLQFQRDMFSVTIPNLKRIGLLSPRVRPLYEQLGVLHYEALPASA